LHDAMVLPLGTDASQFLRIFQTAINATLSFILSQQDEAMLVVSASDKAYENRCCRIAMSIQEKVIPSLEGVVFWDVNGTLMDMSGSAILVPFHNKKQAILFVHPEAGYFCKEDIATAKNISALLDELIQKTEHIQKLAER